MTANISNDSQYLNDTGDSNAEQPEIAEEDVSAEVHGIRAYINMI
jgi:hypothetical protein